MAEPPRETVQLLTGLLGHMRQIVGDNACYAMIHYGALEEGKRFGAGLPPGELAAVLARFDRLLQQRTEILADDGEHVSVKVQPSAPGEQGPPFDGMLLGLIEGALTASRSVRYKGSVLHVPGGILVDLRPDAKA